MSHFTRIRTHMMVHDYLVGALEELGHDFEVGEDLKIRGYQGKKARAEIRVKTQNDYDIGFARNGKGYTILADWWGVRGYQEKDFTRQVTQRYAVVAAKHKLAEQGFDLVSEEKQTGGTTRLVLRRMS